MKLFRKLNEEKVFRDSIHCNIKVEYSLIWDLINSDVLQRLRRIHQLGGTYMVYPTAEHSRFTHSLGVYEVVRRIITEVEDVRNILSEREKIIAMCAGLLHDIGHGPYSHAFEGVFKTDHEVFTQRIILEQSSINNILNNYDETIAQEIAMVIAKTHPNTLLIQMISSQVDADRMDYLLRDAYNCGVSYGNYDMERLLRLMIVVSGKIAFKESGVHVIENYMFARYHMYWQVYLHPTASSFEIVLTKILKRIKELMNNNYQFKTTLDLLKPFASEETLNISDYLLLDESTLIHYFSLLKQEDDLILSTLADCFNNRKLFKYKNINTNQEGDDIINLIEKDKLKQDYYFEKEAVSSGFYQYYGSLNPQSILIKTKTNQLVELHKVSNLVNAIVESAKLKKEIKLYYHQDYMELIDGSN